MANPITTKNPTGAGRPPARKNNNKDENALFKKLYKAFNKLPQKTLNKMFKDEPVKFMNILERLQKQRPSVDDGGGTTMKYYFFPAKNLSDAKLKAHVTDLYNLLEEKKIKFKKYTEEDGN